MARKIADTKNMTHEDWLVLRKSSIGGSDSAACVGMNPYSGLLTLYADKTGMSKERETNEAMRLGTDLEAYVAERFTERTGKKVRNDHFMYADDEYDFLTANLDRRVVGENAGLECKTMGSFNGYDLEADEIPSHYFCQVQHYMMVMGFDHMYLAILVLQRGLYVIQIERDDEFIKTLREAEIRFWKDHVEPRNMPAPGGEADLSTLKEIYPEPAANTEIAIPGLDFMIKDYKALKELADSYKDRAETAKAKICKLLGTNEVGLGDDYGCSWKLQSKASVSASKLKAKYPRIYAELAEVSSYRVFRTRNLTKKGR